MIEYGKTENLFARDEETHKLIPGQFRYPEFGLIAPVMWRITEKLDGTNVRVIVKPDSVELRGRSDKADLPKGLKLGRMDGIPLIEGGTTKLYETLGLPEDVVVTFYGEGVGAGIQKNGGRYCPDKQIRVFDLVTSRSVPAEYGDWQHAWRSETELKQAAACLGLKLVPTIDGFLDWMEMVDYVREGFQTHVGDGDIDMAPAEGIVARTDPYLYFGRNKSRLMFKLKTKDLR